MTDSEKNSARAEATEFETRSRNGEFEVSVRAGRITFLMGFVFVIALIWSGRWILSFIWALGPEGKKSTDAGPLLFFSAALALIGLYCAGLLLWAMIGHERLVMGKGRLRHGNPWLFGAMTQNYRLDSISPFQLHSRDCGADSEGCCCNFTTVDSALTFGHNGRRMPVFPHISRQTKLRLLGELNAALENLIHHRDTESTEKATSGR